ncbi:MAG: precorrin-6A reductase [Eubacteriales bacterium]|nr:precorrin-6A reductase [Eubacteriales bacterium]
MRLVVFSGTSEGHALCRCLSAWSVAAEVYVATAYGAAVMEPMPGITVHEGRLDAAQIADRLDADTLLVDATHPYATAVTANLRAACARTGARYERLLRPPVQAAGAITVPNTAAAVAWLDAHPGKVLLTTGSKELEAYTAVADWRERLYPRVLPSVAVLEKCVSLGFAGSHIIAMQGPFSEEMNAALLRQTGATILVTKDTGASGGFAQKLAAARQTGATALVVSRPVEETGRTLEEMQRYLAHVLDRDAPEQAQPTAMP